MVGEDCILKNVEVSGEPSIGEDFHIVKGCERRMSFNLANDTASLLVDAAARCCRYTCSWHLVRDYKLEGLLESVPAGSEELPKFKAGARPGLSNSLECPTSRTSIATTFNS